MDPTLLRRRAALSEAYNAHDADAAAAFYAAAYVRYIGGRRVRETAPLVSQISRVFLQHPSYAERLTIERHRLSGEGTVLTIVKSVWLSAMFGARRNEHTRTLETWLQVDDTWMLVKEHIPLQPGADHGGWNFPL